MNQESKYRVILLDKSGYDIGERAAENLKEAKHEMAYMLSDQYATVAESTHEIMGTYKVEVRNAKGECVLDDMFSSSCTQGAFNAQSSADLMAALKSAEDCILKSPQAALSVIRAAIAKATASGQKPDQLNAALEQANAYGGTFRNYVGVIKIGGVNDFIPEWSDSANFVTMHGQHGMGFGFQVRPGDEKPFRCIQLIVARAGGFIGSQWATTPQEALGMLHPGTPVSTLRSAKREHGLGM